MDKKIYLRGRVGTYWYNFTEGLAYAITGRPIPDEILYNKKVPYGKEKSQYFNTLCLKDNLEKKKPLFIYIHGGGFVSGITEMRNSYIMNWAKAGFFTCSVNYTYAPQKIFPEQLKEVFAAIDYIFDNSEKYNVDTDNVVLAGESAGGYFIFYVASCLKDPSALEKLGITFKNREKLKLKALVSHSSCYNIENLCDTDKPQSHFPDMKMMLESFTGMKKDELCAYVKTEDGKLLSPQVNDGYPPCFLVWSSNDYLRYETWGFANELRKYNVPYRMFKGDGIAGNHAWTIVTMLKKGKICLKETFDFVLPLLPDYFSKNENKWVFNK